MYKIKIHWGSESARKENEPIEYEFETERDRNFFLEGVDEAAGWLDYEIIEETYDEPEKPEPCPHPLDKREPYHDNSIVCDECNSVIEQNGVKIDPPHYLGMMPKELMHGVLNGNGLNGMVELSDLSDVPLQYKFVYGQKGQRNLWHVRAVYKDVPMCNQHNFMETENTQDAVPGSRICKRCLSKLRELRGLEDVCDDS